MAKGKSTSPNISKVQSGAPGFKVEIDGLDAATQQSPNNLERFVVETHLDKIGAAQITFAGDFSPSSVALGATVKVTVGGSADNAFNGIVTGIRYRHQSGHETVTYEAMDPLVKLAASRETRVWGGEVGDEIVDSDLVGEIISEAGLDAGEVEDTPGSRAYVFQRNESDLAFIKRLAARNGYLVYAEDGEINFKKPQYSDDPVDVHTADAVSLDFTRSDTDIPAAVEVVGWDYIEKETVVGVAAVGSIETIGSGSPPGAVIFDGDSYVGDVFVNSESGAQAMADAEMNRLARSYVRGLCTVPGNGNLKPMGKVKFTGKYANFKPTGLVVGVRHVFEGLSGLQTTFWFVGNTEPE